MSTERTRYTDSLRALADFIDDHPDLPLPSGGQYVSPYLGFPSDETRRAEVDRIAGILGVTPGGDTHYRATRDFGGISYEAVAISSQHMAQWTAERSYAGSVRP